MHFAINKLYQKLKIWPLALLVVLLLIYTYQNSDLENSQELSLDSVKMPKNPFDEMVRKQMEAEVPVLEQQPGVKEEPVKPQANLKKVNNLGGDVMDKLQENLLNLLQENDINLEHLGDEGGKGNVGIDLIKNLLKGVKIKRGKDVEENEAKVIELREGQKQQDAEKNAEEQEHDDSEVIGAEQEDEEDENQDQEEEEEEEEDSNEEQALWEKPKYAEHARSQNLGSLQRIMEFAGFEQVKKETMDWSLLWMDSFGLDRVEKELMQLKPHQKVNRVPGLESIFQKVQLVTSGEPSVPPAFQMPQDLKKLQQFAKDNPKALFLQKNNRHHGIKIVDVNHLETGEPKTFIQQYVDDPYLIDGYRFDIGVFVAVISVNPLRYYIYEDDVFIDICSEKYYPFDPENQKKYIVVNNHKTIFRMPSLMGFAEQKYSPKVAFDYYLQMKEDDPVKLWTDYEAIISNVMTKNEPLWTPAIARYPSSHSFFQLVRFDFVLDSKVKPYLLEVENIPYISYDNYQIFFNTLRLAGVLRGGMYSESLAETKQQQVVQMAEHNYHVFPEECLSEKCSDPENCLDFQCHLCSHCLSEEDRLVLRSALYEQGNHPNFYRGFPRPVNRRKAEEMLSQLKNLNMSLSNLKMHQWYWGKCLLEQHWCAGSDM